MARPAASAAVEANLAAQSTKGDPALPHGGGEALTSKAAEGAHGGAVPHSDPTALGLDGTAWVALAMLAVIALMLWKRVPAAIGRALDATIAASREQLDEARQLRAEAEALKAEYEARAAQAGAEAETMLERARHEAEAIVAQAKQDSAALVERRTRMAEDKIAAAERTAIAQVRARAASAAASAAEQLIREQHDEAADKALVDQAIAGLSRPH